MADIGFGFPSKSGIPVGVVLPFFGTDQDVPDGWLLCDGRKFSVGRYATLAAQLSRAAGVYTDTTPDLRGRVPVGLDNMGGTSANRVVGAWADSFGGASGTENHTLTAAELPTNVITTGTTYTTGAGTVFTVNTGGGNGHNNMQPSIALNYIIKAE